MHTNICLLVSDDRKSKEHPGMDDEHEQNLEDELAENLLA